MGKETAIAWTDHTFNPWWGCQRVSPGCENCYAEAFAKRVGYLGRRSLSGAPDGYPLIWGANAPHRFFGEKHWIEPRKWNASAERDGKRRRVFCASMADVFQDSPELDAPRTDIWSLIHETPWLDWQLLTKRPENMIKMTPTVWNVRGWPKNIWAGCTVEDRKRAAARIEHLKRVPAGLLFLSAEPLLEDLCEVDLSAISWVIVGGESGRGARPFHIDWARQLLAQCRAKDVRFFMKQTGQRKDGSKGDNMSLWPEDIRVQEFPR
jgi:protein gp37